MVEEGEECDCGTVDTCATIDKCCTPSDISSIFVDRPCTLRRSLGYHCSPHVGICCNMDCKYKSKGEICGFSTECRENPTCAGNSGFCPRGKNLPDGKLCENGYKSCKEGNCTQSLCYAKNLRG